MASSSGAKTPESGGQQPAAPSSTAAALRDCESCRSAPGIPFCRVEWSFLCAGCAAVVHGQNWVVAVSPSPNPNSSLSHFPSCPYPFPYPFPFANPSSNPNAVVHLSSDEDELSPADPSVQGPSGGRGPCQAPWRGASCRRMESVIRYREKRKSRRFEKTVRYENRRAYAELRPRVDGKFARRDGGEGGEEAGPSDAVDEAGENVGDGGATSEFLGMDQVTELKPIGGAELGEMVAGGVELEQPDFIEDVRFQ
ncbi:Zinc finger protein CONSTANS-LIKE 4 [Apostasia shenzhenica]|uniref:Zinc finger protein CONSTANS-LIKE 4 n=1 Tax=Apostasia shenzhenica TaxID=1088818 RepID=A0A2I0ARS5_9ASPA|nr:Zinc finger protein CONSTANS-LIKE 4 [Apostasia shenzhenica]